MYLMKGGKMGNSRYYNYGGHNAANIESEARFKERVLDRAAQRRAQKAEAKQWASNKLDKLLVGARLFGDETASAKSLFQRENDVITKQKVALLQRELNKRAKAMDANFQTSEKSWANFVKYNDERRHIENIQKVLNRDKDLAGSKAYSYIDAVRRKKQQEKAKKAQKHRKG